MNLNSINITEIVEQTKAQLQEDKTLTPALKMSIELILVVVVMLASKLGLNSKNSSIPPSKDTNRAKQAKEKSNKSVGGQKGHIGKALIQTDTPLGAIFSTCRKQYVSANQALELLFKNKLPDIFIEDETE